MRRCFAPVDIASLTAVRITFGALMLVAIARYFINGWIDRFFISPRLFFPYQGFEWIVPWPGRGMYAYYALLGGAALGMMLGFAYRLSALVFCLGFTYAHLIDKSTYLNHYYLITLLSALMVWMPLDGVASVAVWRRPERRRETAPVWMLWALRFQLGVVYVFGGVGKLNVDWLWHAQPLRIWLAARADMPILGGFFESSWMAYAMSWGGLLFDLGIVPLLLWRRTRGGAYLLVLAFHLTTSALFPIGMFPWIMIGLTPIFFSPDWPRRLWRHSLQQWRTEEPAPPLPVSSRSRRAGTLGLLATYAAVQLIVPLRVLWKEGPLLWTEDGFRFGWRVMLMEKYAHAELTLRDAVSGETWTVDPRAYLTPLQAGMMATQPDMILSFAHWLAAQWRARGHPQIEVRAAVYGSLNGRPHQLLVDPQVDLAQIGDDVPLATWVRPLRADRAYRTGWDDPAPGSWPRGEPSPQPAAGDS